MPRRDPWTAIALIAFFALLLVALFGERIAPHESIYFVPEHGRDPRPFDPGLVYPFGSDILGRDLVSLVLAGARLTLGIVVLGGLARVLAALLLAVVASLSARARAGLDAISEIVAAVPATLVVLLVVLVFVRGDTTALVFVGALLLTGWAGPYRVLRSELDRLARVAFTEGAAAVGAGRLRIVLRHHVPHVVPLLALNASQQIVASLVALAELGVLGVFVGTTRYVNIEESLSVVRVGQRNAALIADPPEWGGLLANARDTESLWTTRWVFLIPGLAFAAAAVAVAAIGVGLARRYARRDVVADLRGRGAAALLLGVASLMVVADVLPERYAEARSWAADARAAMSGSTPDVAAVFFDAGLRPIGPGYTVERDVAEIRATAPATIQVGTASVRESQTGPFDILPLLYADSGGGTLVAPLVFASWGLSPADFPSLSTSMFGAPDLGKTIADWPDDYANVDVRGKTMVLLRVMGIAAGTRRVSGPDPETSIANALKRGAAGVLFVDPTLPQLPRVPTNRAANPYLRLMATSPVRTVTGKPVVVLGLPAADRLLAPAGVAPSKEYASLESGLLATDGERATRSTARATGVDARIEIPTELSRMHVRSAMGEVAGADADSARVVIWAVMHGTTGEPDGTGVLAALARSLAARKVPVVLVAFDPAVDPQGNARSVAERLGAERVGLILVLDDLTGSALTFTTPYGDLIPAIDTYAEKAGARHVPTRVTLDRNTQPWTWPGIWPFIDTKAIVVSGTDETGDLRPDAAALAGYLAGRLALHAEELPR